MQRQHHLGTAVLACVLWIIQSAGALAQQPRLYVLPDSVSIGDMVTYTIVLPQGQPYQSLVLPDSAVFGKDLELVDRKQFRTAAQSDSIQYQLQYFGTGELRLQGITVGLVNDAQTQTLPLPDVVIPFKTMLQGEEDELRPMKDIYDFAVDWLPYILLLLGFVLLGWLLIRYMRAYLKAKPVEFEPLVEIEVFKNPLDVLEKRLLTLRSDHMLTSGDLKTFYTSLGDALREYLEEVHHLPALETTSRELLRDMDRRMVDPDLIRQTGVVLKMADMVKFAKYETTGEQRLNSIREAEKFLQIARMTDQRKVHEMQKRFDEHQAKEMARKEAETKVHATDSGNFENFLPSASENKPSGGLP